MRIKNIERCEDALGAAEDVGEGGAVLVTIPGARGRSGERNGVVADVFPEADIR